jgi:GBP family porin
MKRLGSALLCAISAGVVHAESPALEDVGVHTSSLIDIYGNIDVAGTWATTGKGTTLPGGTVATPGSMTYKRLDSGVGPGTRLGLRGSKDIGGGTNLFYDVEMGFAIDSGVLQQGGSAFGRQAYVGGEKKIGDVTLTLSAGRQYSPLNYAVAYSDAMYGFYWGSTYAISGFGIYESIGDAAGSDFGATARVDNSVMLKATSGGWLGRLMVAAGNENSRGTGRLINPQIQYTTGGLILNASVLSYKQNAGALTATAEPAWRTEGVVGASYDFQVFKLSGGYFQHNAPGNPANLSATATVGAAGASPFAFSWKKLQMPYIGAAIPLPVGKLSFDLSYLKYKYATGPDGKSYGIGTVYEYPLNKSASLYVSAAHINNDSRSRTPMISTISAVTPNGFGSDPSVVSVGMQYAF